MSAWMKTNATGAVPVARSGHRATLVDKKLYVFGGCGNRNVEEETEEAFYLDDLSVLETGSLKWLKMDAENGPSARANHTMLLHDRKLWVYGGTIGYTRLGDLWTYDVDNKVWTEEKCEGSPPLPRAYHAAVFVDSTMYIFGGLGDKVFGELALLKTEGKEWIKPEIKGTPPSARSDHTMAAHNSEIVLFGGRYHNNRFNDVYLLDTETLTWSSPKLSGTPPDPRCNHTSMNVGNKVVVWGGQHEAMKFFNDMYTLDFVDNGWVWNKPNLDGTLPPAREQHAMSYDTFSKKLYVFGGWCCKWLNDLYCIDCSRLDTSKQEAPKEAAAQDAGPVVQSIDPSSGLGLHMMTITGTGFPSDTPVTIRFRQGDDTLHEVTGEFESATTIKVAAPDLNIESKPVVRVDVRFGDGEYTRTGADYQVQQGETKEGDKKPDEAAAAEAPKEEVAKDEAPKEEAPKEEVQEEAPKEGEAAEEEAPKEGEAAEEEAPKEEATNEEAPKEEAANEEAPKEAAANEEAPKEEAANEEAPKEEATNEEAPKEEAANEEARLEDTSPPEERQVVLPKAVEQTVDSVRPT